MRPRRPGWPLTVGRLLDLSGRAVIRAPGVMVGWPALAYGAAAGLTYGVSRLAGAGWTWLVWAVAATAATSLVAGTQVMHAAPGFPGADPSLASRGRDRWRTTAVVWLLAAMLVPLVPFVWVTPWYWHIIMTTPSGSDVEDMRPVSMMALGPVSLVALVVAVVLVVKFAQALPAAACESISPGQALTRASTLAPYRGSFALLGVIGPSSLVLVVALLVVKSAWQVPFGLALAAGSWLVLMLVEPLASALVAGLYLDARRLEYDRYLAWSRRGEPTGWV